MRDTIDKGSGVLYHIDLDEAVDVYGDMVYRVAMTIVKNPTDAQDVFQETFLKLVRYRETIESEEHLKAWLIRVATNCAKSLVTSSWYQKTEELSQDLREEQTQESEQSAGLIEHLKKLPDKYRMVLYLFYYEEYSVKEIGGILVKKESTVKSLLSRGRDMLRTELLKGGYRV